MIYLLAHLSFIAHWGVLMSEDDIYASKRKMKIIRISTVSSG